MTLPTFGGFSIGTQSFGGSPAADVVTATITAPTSTQVLTTSTLTATWSYASQYGVAQGWYRLRIYLPATSLVVYDSGYVAGAATSLAPGVTLLDGSSYVAEVTLKNATGVVSTASTVTFSVSLTDPTSYTDEARVGSFYEVGINGVGYMLADDPAGKYKYGRQTVPLEAQKLVSSSTLFDERVDHYNFVTLYDWAGGAGQTQFNRANSDPTRFYDSDGVNCFNQFQLTLLPATATSLADVYSGARCVVAGDKLYAVTAATQLKYQSDPSGSPTTISLTAAQTVTDLASDGQFWYAAHGGASEGIARGATSATLNWSAIAADSLWYAGQRLCVSYKVSGSGTPRTFSTLADDGTEEVASGRKVLPAGWTIVKGTGGGGFIFFGAYAGDVGVIYKWAVGSSDAPSVALELQKGQIPVELFWYQGNVMVRTKTLTTASGARATIHRCVADTSGNLTPFEVVTLGTVATATDYSVGSFAGDQNKVYFSWPLMNGTVAGVGAIDLATGAYSKWLKAAAAGAVPSVFAWRGKVGFMVVGTGAVFEQDTYLTSGTLTSSVIDMNSALDKVWDTVGFSSLPLASGQSVALAYSLDGGNSFTAWSDATLSTAGQSSKTTTLAHKSRTFALKVTLTGDSTSTPTLTLVSTRMHALGLADTMLVLPIVCDDQVQSLNGRNLPDDGPGAGARRLRTLESLVQTRIRLQDVDWATTATAEVYEVEKVEAEPVMVYDRSVNRNSVSTVAVVTLRKLAR